jgi:hypothetical protein
LGASWNPLTTIKISSGAYLFENAQTGHWNSAPYIGVSVNIVQGLELLKMFGLGDVKPPKIVAK